MKKALLAALLLLGPVARAQKEPPPPGTAPKPFALPKIERFTLANGIVVTMVPYGTVPKTSITAIVRAGNVNEGPDQVWLADLTGNMLKEGTTSRTNAQIAAEAGRMGGQLFVGAGSDTTSLGGEVLSDFVPEFVALLGDVIERPAFPESELARLKTDQIRQLTIARTQPRPLASERFRKLLYPNHPYGRLYPTERMIQDFTLQTVKKFYGDNFGAARTAIYVAGRFDAAAVRKAVTREFEHWTRGPDIVTNVPKPVAERALHLIDRPGAAQSTLYLGLPVIDPSHADYIPFTVTNALLGGSFGSRITANIREQKGYTYSPTSVHSTRYRDADWVEIADVTTGVTGPALKEIFVEIERLQKEPPGADELQGIKNYLAGVFVLRNSSRQGIIGQLAFLTLHGLDEHWLSDYVQRIYAVTPADVQRITQTYLKPERMTIVVVGDKSKVADQLKPFGTAQTSE